MPPESTDSAEALSRFIASQDQLLQALADGRDLALDRLKTISPFARQVRYNVWSSFCVTAAYQRRHLLQAEGANDASG